MAESKLANGIEKIVSTSAKSIGTFQINIDKILWGDPTKANKATVKATDSATQINTVKPQTEIVTTTGVQSSKVLKYNTVETTVKKPNASQRLAATGLFNALDALISVDLCNVVSYAYDSINVRRSPRPERSTWTEPQTLFYTLQDQAGIAVSYIDKFTSYPSVFIGSYTGVGPNAIPIQEAVTKTNAPAQGGIAVQAYNMFYLLKSLEEVFTLTGINTRTPSASEDTTLVRQVPGLSSNLNFVTDFIKGISKYTDYTQISTSDLLALQVKIGKLRAVCVTIQNLNFKSGIALAGNFIGIDIRREAQKLSEFVDITKIIPTLKEVNSNIRAFIRISNQVQKIISIGQFVIKIAILLVRVFKFITLFFKALPLPGMFITSGIQITLQELATTAKTETNGLTRVLKAINALLKVVVGFLRYLTVNANELLIRLDKLLLTLDACDAFKSTGSATDILTELKETRGNLKTLLDQLATYIVELDTRTDPTTATFGIYDIRVVEEDLVESTIRNRRRRGVALDKNGAIVAQSDLTFATDTQVIIGEVRQKLISQGLVGPQLGAIDLDTLTAINESLTYLDNNDVLQNDLNITATEVDLPDNLDETQGLGLNAFINNLKGGKKLRTRVREALKKSKTQLDSQVAAEKTQAAASLTRG